MLADLPNELLSLVAKSLYRPLDVYHLAVSSRRISEIVVPLLYSEVTLCNNYLYASTQVSRFFYTISQRPKLANAVQYLQLETWDTQEDFSSDLPDKTSFTHNAEIIGPLVAKAKMSDEKRGEWVRDIEKGITDAWLALIIPQLTQLRKISITWPANFDEDSGPESWFLKMLKRASLEETPVFPCLKEAHFTWHDTENSIGSDVMLPFFKFPAMRKLTGCMVEDISGDLDPETPIVPTSDITEISLCCSGGLDGGLRDWIASCKALRAFSFHFGGALVTTSAFNPRPVIQSLLLHKATLESLYLRNDEPMYTDEEPDKIETFAGFTVLKHLHVGVDALVEMDTTEELKRALPCSLETLHLYGAGDEDLERTIQQLEGVVDSKHMPKLVTLTVEANVTYEWRDINPKLEDLALRCLKAEVSFNVIKGRVSKQMVWEELDPNRPGVVRRSIGFG